MHRLQVPGSIFEQALCLPPQAMLNQPHQLERRPLSEAVRMVTHPELQVDALHLTDRQPKNGCWILRTRICIQGPHESSLSQV